MWWRPELCYPSYYPDTAEEWIDIVCEYIFPHIWMHLYVHVSWFTLNIIFLLLHISSSHHSRVRGAGMYPISTCSQWAHSTCAACYPSSFHCSVSFQVWSTSSTCSSYHDDVKPSNISFNILSAYAGNIESEDSTPVPTSGSLWR